MSPTIEQIDPANEPVLRAWWEVGAAAEAERAYDAWPPWERTRRRMRVPRRDGHRVSWLAIDGRTAVGQATAWFFGLDNTHLVHADIKVRPEHRRRGIGRALLAEVETHARAAGRRTVAAGVHAPLAEDNAGVHFAAAMGYPVGSVDEIKLLDLPGAVSTWDHLDAEVAAGIGDHRVEVLDEEIPDRLIDAVALLHSELLGQIPLGDLEIEPATWTPRRVRETEATLTAAGETVVRAVALAPDGTPAGFTDVAVHPAARELASVGATLVLPAHRGHRLGLAMKLATHRHLAERFPGTRWVDTANAHTNGWMSSINERMGYRVVERALEMQKRL